LPDLEQVIAEGLRAMATQSLTMPQFRQNGREIVGRRHPKNFLGFLLQPGQKISQ
jgi:hypothetical protein